MISLDHMSSLAQALIAADAEVEEIEAQLARKKEQARQLREETIPCAMQELGLSALVLDTGEKLQVKDDVYASIPPNLKEQAFDWLNENNFGGLIKVEVTTAFSKGQADSAMALYNDLVEKNYAAEYQENVHSQTLKAFLREQLSAGKDIPLELFGARPVFTTKITTPNKKGSAQK